MVAKNIGYACTWQHKCRFHTLPPAVYRKVSHIFLLCSIKRTQYGVPAEEVLRLHSMYTAASCALQRSIFLLCTGLSRVRIAVRPAIQLQYTVRMMSQAPQPVPVVLLHGLASSRKTWDGTVRHLEKVSSVSAARKLQIYTPEILGHGLLIDDDTTHDAVLARVGSIDAQTAHLRSYCEANGIEKAIWIGHSMGGRLSTVLADRHPELVQCLIIVDIDMAPRGKPVDPDPAAFAFCRKFSTWDDALAAYKTLEPTCDPDQLLGQKIILDDASGMYVIERCPYREGVCRSRILTSDAPGEAFKNLGRHCFPVYLLRAADMSFTAVSDTGCAAMVEALPRLLVSSVPGANHRMMKSAPDAFHAEIDRILAEHLGTRVT
jgi:pimeloyl-ACP methyl ester carboxylesterase